MGASCRHHLQSGKYFDMIGLPSSRNNTMDTPRRKIDVAAVIKYPGRVTWNKLIEKSGRTGHVESFNTLIH
jgi:hypothetical protein